MTKFSIGDRVKIIKCEVGDLHHEGKVGKISRVCNLWGDNYHVEIGRKRACCASELSLIKPKPKKKDLTNYYVAHKHTSPPIKRERKPKHFLIRTGTFKPPPKKEGKIELIEKDNDEKIFLRLGTNDDAGIHEYVEVTPIVDKINELIDAFNTTQKEGKR